MGNKNNTTYTAWNCDCDNGCGCENGSRCDNDSRYDNGSCCENDCRCDNGSRYENGSRCGCDNGCYAEETASTGRCCDVDNDYERSYENGAACNGGCQRSHNRCKHSCGCEQGDETHVYYEPCDGCKEISVTGSCRQDEFVGRTLDVNTTLRNVCPGRRSALGLTLTEVDENGVEYARGFQAVTVPAHNGRCNQDVKVETVRFILPEDLSLQNRRHFIVRTQHHYLDAGNIWNND